MMVQLLKCQVVLAACIVLLAGCSTRRSADLFKTTIVIGDVKIARKGTVEPLVKDQNLRQGDTVIVGENAKLKIELAEGSSWYLSKSSRLTIEKPVLISGSKQRIAATLTSGQLHIVKRSDDGNEFYITSSAWVTRVTAADVTIVGSSDPKMCSVILLNGFTSFSQQGINPTVIPVCSKLEAGELMKGELRPLTNDDINMLKSWVGTTIVDEALGKSGCEVGDTIAVAEARQTMLNLAPEWKRTPAENIHAGSTMDTVDAIDPEQGAVIYKVEAGPRGMSISSSSGVITYKNIKDGTYPILLSATDSMGMACTTSIRLEVSGSISLKLLAPSKIEPGQPFKITALIDKSKAGPILKYRFDLDGDGKFDFPKNGQWGKISVVKNHVFAAEGTFKIKGEALGESGASFKASRQITVNAPPQIAIKVSPQIVKAGSPVTFDFSGSKDTRNGDLPLLFKVDVNGDGKFDLPQKGNLTSDNVEYAYSEPGNYHVVVLGIDKDGASANASADVVVSKGGSVLELTGPDTGLINASLNYRCTIKETDFPVTGFTWICSDGRPSDKISGKSETSLIFTSAGEYTITCNATDEKGQTSAISRKVIIQNLDAEIDAGGPYKVFVNTKMTFKGKAADSDSRITLYSWDADGNGTADVTSRESPSSEFTYAKSGTYKAVFIIETDDGKTARDTVLVEVINFPPKALAGADIVSRPGRKIAIEGSGSDTDGVIVKYEWDFDGDGVFDWESGEGGMVTHAFKAYSKAILRVVDADGAIATDTLIVIICPEGMETVGKGKFCIDVYEYPNKRGVIPQTDVTYKDAGDACAKQGKRLCTSDEWQKSCNSGRKNNVFPYGKQFEVERCNTLGNPHKKNSIAEAGLFVECASESGLHDMSGNVAEWTNDNGTGVAFGGAWQNGEEESRCSSRVTLSQNKKYFHTGFRCCK